MIIEIPHENVQKNIASKIISKWNQEYNQTK